MKPSPRVDYDRIAHLYDAQPYRAKSVDPELLVFLGQRRPADIPAILDVGCGTGNQLVANRTAVPDARLVGIDRSLGMLRQAQSKSPRLAWVQADGAMVPFKPASFDFISCQFAFHHLRDKTGMLRAVFQALRGGGRFVLRNSCPQECADRLYYEYFPQSYAVDLQDFWSPEAIMTAMTETGFAAVMVEREHLHFDEDLRVWLETVRRRDTCSQLLSIPDAAYQAGVRRLEHELADADGPPTRANHICLITVRGDKRIGSA
ncbi:MAG TPA: methyltransferase domain-containing protein [Stellaceae bacterium]|jgi:SAM-dependent methyltransferase